MRADANRGRRAGGGAVPPRPARARPRPPPRGPSGTNRWPTGLISILRSERRGRGSGRDVRQHRPRQTADAAVRHDRRRGPVSARARGRLAHPGTPARPQAAGGAVSAANARRLSPDRRGQRHHRLVRRRLELLLQQHFVHPRMLQRGRAVAGRHQRLHQADGDPGVERILRRQLAPPLGRLDAVSALCGPLGQALERGGVVSREARALLLQPALELGRVRDVEAVEEWPDILGGGALRDGRP